MMKMELPSSVLHSLFALNGAGFEAFAVGGCVRDPLMGKQPYDWDITTSALPEQILTVFRAHRTIETGIRHGTVTVMMEETPLEITTYRVDGNYSDSRHPDTVTFTRSLTEDLRRRDFTVNAMAYHPTAGLVDPFRGQADLHHRIIRCVGDPETRFTEDALRILRGLRFSATLDFFIDPATARAIHRLAPSLAHVSVERVATEFTKLLCGTNVNKIFCDYANVLAGFLPQELDLPRLGAYIEKAEPQPLTRYGSLLFTTPPKTVRNLAERLKFSRRFTEDLTALIEHKTITLSPNGPDILQLLHRLGPDLARVLLSLRRVYDNADYKDVSDRLEQSIRAGACYQICHLAVKGNDLVDIGIPPGPQVGRVLNALLEAVMAGTCANTRDKLLNLVKSKSLC